VTHAHDLVRHYNKRVIILQDGEVIADGGLKNPIAPPVPAVPMRPGTGWQTGRTAPTGGAASNWQP